MKQPLQKLRRFFTRTKKFNATTANPDALSAAYDDDDGASRLSGAFVVVLLLHIVALVGVFAFARIKDSRSAARSASPQQAPPAATPAETPAPKLAGQPPKQPAQGTVPVTPAAPSTQANPASPSVPAAAVVAHTETRPAIETPRTLPKGMYLVKTGENLTKIAANHNVSVADLVKANNLKNENDVRAGQELKIPEPSRTAARTPEPKKPTETASTGVYVVRKNDNIVKISTALGVKSEELMRVNNIKDPKKLQEGQKLKVPKKG